ncbi:hypothetical protein LTR95_014696 [Oleoguttula sp. CCFEE 5521]
MATVSISPTTYDVYTAESLGVINHIKIFIETHKTGPNTGCTYEVTGTIVKGGGRQKYEEDHAASDPANRLDQEVRSRAVLGIMPEDTCASAQPQWIADGPIEAGETVYRVDSGGCRGFDPIWDSATLMHGGWATRKDGKLAAESTADALQYGENTSRSANVAPFCKIERIDM